MNPNTPPPVPANMPRSARAAFPCPHLKAADLPPGGATYRIASVAWKQVRPLDAWELKPIVWFTTPNGTTCSKYLILNKTACEAITVITASDDFDAWTGHLIHLSPAQTRQHQDTIAVSPAPADLAAKYAAKPEAASPVLPPRPQLREMGSQADVDRFGAEVQAYNAALAARGIDYATPAERAGMNRAADEQQAAARDNLGAAA